MASNSTDSASDPIVGIDLGTTNSLVARADGDGPRILTGRDGDGIVPSVVRYAEDGRVEAVGREAREHAIEFPERTIRSAKRLMGRALQDVEGDLPYLGYEVVAGEHETARVRIGGQIVSPQEVSAAVLRTLRERASASLGTPVRRAVVTVPAYFDDAQRQATRDAGRIAGLDVVRIVNEPTAAALAYGVGLGGGKARTIAVYDLGGGTFDVSILRVTPAGEGAAGADCFEVLSTAGDTRLGGDDVDQMLASMLLADARARLGMSFEFPPHARQALQAFAEAAKVRLSTEESATIRLSLDSGGALERTITRAQFEELIAPWVERTIARCRQALRDARLEAGDIETVVLVGGSTRIPLVRARVGELFGVEPYTALDPDLVVALGAAVQASILEGGNRSALLLDVIPLSLGIETVGGGVAKLIVRNQSAPARATEMFSTSVDGQTSIRLHVVQGEREMAADCRSLGVFHLGGLPPMPAGIPQVQVEFMVDASGVLRVAAVERRSGKRASLQIVPSHGLSRDEVERLEGEALAHAREDMTRHRVADLVVNARLDLKWVGETLDRVRADLTGEEASTIDEAIGRLRTLCERAASDWSSVDPDEFHRAKEALDRVSMRMHEVAIARSLRED